MKKFLNRAADERGIVLTVMLLILLPLFIWAYVCSSEQAQVTYQVDIDVQQALEDATRCAAMCMNEQAQANADPMIDCDRANEIFKAVLAMNLSLDPDTLEPLENSGLRAKPEYVLIVYNGQDNVYGVDRAMRYTSDSSTGSMYSCENSVSFPVNFYITGEDITADTGDIVTSLNSPGCVALLNVSLAPVVSGEYDGTRWAAAEIEWGM